MLLAAALAALGSVACEPNDKTPPSQVSTERTAPPPETGMDKTPTEPGRPEPTDPTDTAQKRTDDGPETLVFKAEWSHDELIEKIEGLSSELRLKLSEPIALGERRLYIVSAAGGDLRLGAIGPEHTLSTLCLLSIEPVRDNMVLLVVQNPGPVLRSLSPEGRMAADVFETFVGELRASVE